MANTLEDLGGTVQELMNRSLKEQIRVAQQYNRWIQQSSAPDVFGQAARSNYFRFMAESATDYTRNVAKLTFDYYNSLLKLSTLYSDKFFSRVMNVPVAGPEEMKDESALTRVQVELSAPVGAHATRTFILENKRLEATDIGFLVSEFRDADARHQFDPKLQFQPEGFRLAAGEERSVELDLDLDPQFFTPGGRYTATVLVTGSDVILSLAVMAASQSDAA
jgi:hypothetical protein